MMDALRATLAPWLGEPQWKQTEGRLTFAFRFASEGTPSIPLRLKVEINSREHFTAFGYRTAPFSVTSRWFKGACDDIRPLLAADSAWDIVSAATQVSSRLIELLPGDPCKGEAS